MQIMRLLSEWGQNRLASKRRRCRKREAETRRRKHYEREGEQDGVHVDQKRAVRCEFELRQPRGPSGPSGPHGTHGAEEVSGRRARGGSRRCGRRGRGQRERRAGRRRGRGGCRQLRRGGNGEVRNGAGRSCTQRNIELLCMQRPLGDGAQ